MFPHHPTKVNQQCTNFHSNFQFKTTALSTETATNLQPYLFKPLPQSRSRSSLSVLVSAFVSVSTSILDNTSKFSFFLLKGHGKMSWYPTDPSRTCVEVNVAGFPYENLACLYSGSFGKTYFEFEKKYDPVFVRDVMVDNPWVPIVAVSIYAIGIVGGKRFFTGRPAWNWRGSMAAWNLFLSVFSCIGFLRTLPQLIHNLYNYNLTENLCLDPESHYGSGPTGLWIQMFCLSKFPELWDTFFIVIHKKPLIFLHWYHHVSVLLYCWHAYVTKAPGGIFFATMNYGVHAIMYFYYFLMAVKLKPKWFNSMWITVSQISQMVVGVVVTVLGFVLAPSYDKECALSAENNTAALIMYGSYLLLFLEFFFQRYRVQGKRTVVKTVKKD